jgi:uncharacterized SAM-binding protein YcdF (DUF218 family)
VVTLTAGLKYLVPGSLIFLLAATALATLLLFGSPGAARWGRRLLAGVVLLYAVLSLQGTSDLLLAPLRGPYTSIRTPADARGASVIVVLSNGAVRVELEAGKVGILNVQSAYNVLEAARLYTLLDHPRILASGGPQLGPNHTTEARAMADALVNLGVPREAIALEELSHNTVSQAVHSVRWLKAEGVSTFVLVTTPEHVRRAAGAFRAHGTEPIVSLSALDYGGPPFWRPTRHALNGSGSAIYEYLAWFYYSVSGRM